MRTEREPAFSVCLSIWSSPLHKGGTGGYAEVGMVRGLGRGKGEVGTWKL
jgi:hypothetical protein